MKKRTIRALSYAALATMLALPPVMAGAQADDTQSFEVIGLIEAASLNSLTVNGQPYDITQAEVAIPMTLGSAVKLEGSAVDGQIVSMDEVKALDDDDLQPGELKLKGTVEALTINGIQVAGQMIDLSTAAIETGVVVGDHAELTFFVTPETQLVLTHVEPSSDDQDDRQDTQNDDGDDLSVIGTLQQVSDGVITVSGIPVDTTSITLRPLVIGSVVEVDARIINSGFVADDVEYEDTDDDDDDGIDDDDENSSDDDDDRVNIGNNCAIAIPTGWTTYVVTSGDSLSSIASRTDSSVQELAQINCIANPSSLSAGVTLAVPRTPDPRPIFIDNDDDNGDDDNGGDDQGGGNDDDNGGDDNDDNSGPGGGGGGNNDDDDDDDDGGDDDDDDD